MKTLALATALVLVCASSARAAGETFTLRWVEDRYCDEGAPLHRVGAGYLAVLSDTQLDLCTDLFLCSITPPTTLFAGTTTPISRHRAVFIGSAPGNLFYSGPLTIQAELELGANGQVRGLSGTFIAPAVEGAYCAARGRFRTTRRTD